jgi:hypothetical protein
MYIAEIKANFATLLMIPILVHASPDNARVDGAWDNQNPAAETT